MDRFFPLAAEKQIERGAHKSLKQLIAAIYAFIARHNKNANPLSWTKSADGVLASIERFCQRMLDVHAQTG